VLLLEGSESLSRAARGLCARVGLADCGEDLRLRGATRGWVRHQRVVDEDPGDVLVLRVQCIRAVRVRLQAAENRRKRRLAPRGGSACSATQLAPRSASCPQRPCRYHSKSTALSSPAAPWQHKPLQLLTEKDQRGNGAAEGSALHKGCLASAYL
jgi:hypothetical protein